MNIISFLIDFVLHMDRYLGLIIQEVLACGLMQSCFS